MNETPGIGPDRAALGQLLFNEPLGFVDVLIYMVHAVFLDDRRTHSPGNTEHIAQVQLESDFIGVGVPERSARLASRTEVSPLFFDWWWFTN